MYILYTMVYYGIHYRESILFSLYILVYLFILLFFCPFNRMIFMSRFRRRHNNLYKAVLYPGTTYIDI